MGFNADLADMVGSIDEELGEPATWSGVTGEVRVHFEEDDRLDGFAEGQILVRTRLLAVHRSQVPQPRGGDIATLLESNALLKVISDSNPQIDRDGYWICEVKPVQP